MRAVPIQFIAATGILALICGSAAAATITATASGSTTPSTTTVPGSIINGDFTITQLASSPGDSTLGNGLNEDTTWAFDFTSDPNFGSFSASVPLASALLTLTLTTTFGIDTDTVVIDGLPQFDSSAIRGLPVGVTQTVQLELLDYYSSGAILAAFSGGDFGKIPMIYSDDSIVSFARLTLAPVPLPAAFPLFGTGLGLMGLFGLWRRRRAAAAAG